MNSKIIKKIIIFILILISTILISSLKNECLGYYCNDIENVNGINFCYCNKNDLFTEGKTMSFNLNFMKNNNFTFCVQNKQTFNLSYVNNQGSNYYNVCKKFEINAQENNKIENGLAYILCNNYEFNRSLGDSCKMGVHIHSNPIQLALWAYLKDYGNAIKTFDGYQGKIYCGNSKNNNEYGDVIVNYNTETISFYGVDVSEANKEQAYEIYKKAKDLGTSKIYKATFYLYTSVTNKNQNFILVTSNEIKDNAPTITVDFYKKMKISESKLSGAKIEVTKVNNVKGLTTDLHESWDSGSLGRVEITPIDSDKSVKIHIKEIAEPNGVSSGIDKDLEISFDKNGNITSINNNTDFSLGNTNAITVYNEPKTIKLKLNKQDFFGKNLSGAELQIDTDTETQGRTENLTKLSNKEFGLVSSENGIFKGNSDTIEIVPKKWGGNNWTVKLTLTEIIAPEGYSKFNDGKPVIMTITYEDDQTIEKIDFEDSEGKNLGAYFKYNEDTITLTVKDPPAVIVNLSLFKKGPNGEALKGSVFKFESNPNYTYMKGLTNLKDYTEDKNLKDYTEDKNTYGLITNDKGEFYSEENQGNFIEIFDENQDGSVIITLTEIVTPEGYVPVNNGDPIKIRIEYDVNTGKINKIISLTDGFTIDNNSNIKLETTTNEVTITDPKTIKLKLNKQDFNCVGLNGATIQISDTDGSYIKGLNTLNTGYGLTSKKYNGKDGVFVSKYNEDYIEIYPKTWSATANENGKVKILVKEISAPDGYELMNDGNSVQLTVTYDNSGNVVSIAAVDLDKKGNEINEESIYITSSSSGEASIIIKNLKTPEYYLKKIDAQTNEVISGINFKVKVELWSGATPLYIEKNSNTITTDSGGKGVNIINDEIKKQILSNYNGGDLEIWLTIEEKDSEEYINAFGSHDIVLKYDGVSTKVISDQGWSDKKDEYWDYNDEVATLTVKNYKKLPLELKINKTDSITKKTISGITFDIALNGIGIENENGGKTTNLQETTNSNGIIDLKNLVIDDINKEFTITLKEQKKEGYSQLEDIVIKLKRTGDKYNLISCSPENIATLKDQTLTLNIENIPSIDLSGRVWNDGQIGVKDIEGPNGKIDTDEDRLKDVTVYLYSIKDKKIFAETTTDDNGYYEFKDITKTKEGYKIYFEYNGIVYDDVGIQGDSKAKEDETERNTLNGNFKTIDVNGSNGYKYGEYTGEEIKNNKEGTLYDKNFAIKAYTDTYTETTKDINCGLTERFFDLALGTDVEEARITINGKDKKYTYAEIMDGELKDLDLDKLTQNNSSETNGVEYTLYLYYSDYNFRIEDYKTDMTEGIKDTTYGDHSVVAENVNEEQELEVYVTYSIILKNQSKQPGTVEEFVYYYDDKYISPTIAEMDDYDYAIDEVNKKITFTHKGNSTLNKDNDYRKEIEVTFKVNKDSNGYVLKGDFSNAGEIIEYSTPNGGFIDDDSAPGNAKIYSDNGQKKITNYEDDCDEAEGLEIALKNEKRTIAGTVFEDANKNGSNDDNTPVNAVIVQLIELKTIKGSYYEYIWQETRSGSNTVRVSSGRNGYTGTEYTSDASGDGTYQFKEFIPGNYIIRFIYGDGSTYDITSNVQQYNGQDYKSTIDNSYKEEWYNQANYNGKSVARDNEARRLEVMAYSTTIKNDEISNAINNKTEEMLKATWMCAETSKVNVAVEGDNTSYANMNFGLALRPQTKLTLEKHITGLKITPQGTGVQPIVDAKIVNEEIQGITTGLARIDSTRGNRGFWKVETDIEELAQGATVELEYTYTIKNESDEDYLSATLINEYKNLNSEEYAKYLSNIVDENQGNLKNKVKGNTNTYGTYLGEYYYTGTKGSTDSEVLSTVNVIEDNLNNNLKLVEETDMKFEKVNNNAIEKTVYDDAGNAKTEKIETVIKNKTATETLAKDAVDSTRTAKLTTTLSASSKEISYPTYIGEIAEYTNAAGRKDMKATPGNLSYVHSEDTSKTMENSNEHDEFWGETLMVSKPTGENKQAPVQIIVIAISSVAVIGVGIILVKKYVLK
jgi:hypothetical protein